jgi:Cu(I)/Ag(I) efflux system membrane fusion protein
MKDHLKKIFMIPLLSFLLLAGCKQKPMESHDHEHEMGAAPEEKKIEYYTCTMHRFIHSDKPGNCPICGMKLVPVYAQGAESQPLSQSGMTESAPSGRGPVVLDEARQQRSGVKVETAERRKLVREIEAPARVAYDPNLLIAQSDYLVARRTGGGELGGLQGGFAKAAKTRLQLLGMSEVQIRALEKQGKADLNLLVPQTGQTVQVTASVFESDLPWIHPGMTVQVVLPGEAQPLSTELSAIVPTIDPMTRTATLRFSLPNSEGRFRPDMYLKAKLVGETEPVLTIPEGALIDTGKEQLVFVESSPGRYEPKSVRVGRRGSSYVEILQGLNEGDRVAASGNFLLDSESRLRGGN